MNLIINYFSSVLKGLLSRIDNYTLMNKLDENFLPLAFSQKDEQREPSILVWEPKQLN